MISLRLISLCTRLSSVGTTRPHIKALKSLKNKEIIVQRGDIMHEYAVEK